MTKTPKGSPELDEARLRQQAIGARLRQLFDEVINEPVPDDFLEILRRAEPADPLSPAAGRKSHVEGDDA